MTDRIILGVMLVLAAAYFYATSQIPFLEIGDIIGPQAFPHLLVVALLVSAGLLVLEMRRAPKVAPRREPEIEAERPRWSLLCGIVVWTAAYAAAFEHLGFVAATAIYLIACTAYFNRGRWVTNVLTSVLFSVGSYLLFQYLGVILPPGVLPL